MAERTSQRCTSRQLHFRSAEREQGSQGRVSVPVSLRSVPPKGHLPSAQCAELGMVALGKGCITSDISGRSDKSCRLHLEPREGV